MEVHPLDDTVYLALNCGFFPIPTKGKSVGEALPFLSGPDGLGVRRSSP
ncbi:MAG: hypothetical protein L5657_09650 [Calditerricola sp.]|nr:hypothetical protein [Calditerricola sp.]